MQKSSLLRVLTCGSVDDGKSTLIGCLLHKTGAIADDELAVVKADSDRFGSVAGDIDYALLVDGLEAERAQGITIDVAYRYMSTPARNFILVDTPGHEQFTCNMVTGASNVDIAIILIDARKGVLKQTRRHAAIVHALGVPHVVLAVNKMDLVDWSQDRFNEIVAEFEAFARKLGLGEITAIPVVAITGVNLTEVALQASWYRGQTLLEVLNTCPVNSKTSTIADDLRLPVQWVCRPDQNFRGYAGTVVNGSLSVGQAVVALPSGGKTSVAGIETPQGPVGSAPTGTAVMIRLADEISIVRGDVLVSEAGHKQPSVAGILEARLVWMSSVAMLPGREYIMRLGPTERIARITRIRHKIDIETFGHLAARTLALNEIGDCEIALNADLVFDPYATSRDMGGFILIDRVTGATVSAGMINFALHRSANIQWQVGKVDASTRSTMKGQTACCIWLTGLSGAGKSTIASALEKRLVAMNRHVYVLDGDNVRHGLNRDLGFTDADRVENVRRIAEVSRLMVDAGLITIVASISPFRAERDMAAALFPADVFIETFVDSSFEV